MLFIEKRTFNLGHNLVLGYVPDIITEEVLDKAFKDNPPEIRNFGLFGNDIDFNAYYPDVKAEDLQPTDADFVEPLFRGLSETVLNTHYDPISFEKPGVLKKSMNLILGQSVYPNHEAAVGNELGSVSKVFWQEKYISKEGIEIPAGFNVKLKIDGKSNPKIARGVMMNPPSIHSASVTVTFAWEKSHPELSDQDFRNLRGSMGSDGRMIMKVASKIIAYHEISFVPHGADPFAQKVNDEGEIVNPKYAKTRSSFSSIFDFKTEDGKFEIETISNSQNNQQNQDAMEFSDFLAQLKLGDLQFNDIEALADHVKKMSEGYTQLQAIIEKTGENPIEFIDNLVNNQKTDEEKTILSFIEANQGLDKVKERINLSLSGVRDEAVKFYKLLHTDDYQQAIEDTIRNSEMEAAQSFLNTYKKEFEENVPLSCKDCGSTNIDRSSFIDGKMDPIAPKPKSIEELRKSFKTGSGVKGSDLHKV